MKRRVLPKTLPKQTPIDPAEREYFRKLKIYANAWGRLVKEELAKILAGLKDTAKTETPPTIAAESRTDSVAHMDANIEKEIAKMFASVQQALMKLFPDSLLRKWADQMVSHVNQTSKGNTTRLGKAVDLEVEPLMKDGKLNPYFKNVIDENVGLIRSISTAKIPAFKNYLVNAITNDSHNTDFWEGIQKYVDNATFSVKSHAKLIARDQVSKLNGKLNQYRQQQLGGTRYTWRTSEDERVREDHKKLDGKVFKWTNPPVVDRRTGRRGHPGYDFQCRCTAEMVLEDVVD